MASTVPGTLKVSNDCLADLAGSAALECYGVVGMAVIEAPLPRGNRRLSYCGCEIKGSGEEGFYFVP